MRGIAIVQCRSEFRHAPLWVGEHDAEQAVGYGRSRAEIGNDLLIFDAGDRIGSNSGVEMQKFEAVFQRDRVTNVTRALAERGIAGFFVQAVNSHEAPIDSFAEVSDFGALAAREADAVKLELTVDDQLSREVFQVLSRTAGTGRISQFPTT